MPGVYPPIEPYDSGLLDVGDGNRVYWEACGNPDGKPAVFLHGGPGGGCSPGHRRMFDPARYRVVLFDQRNCGRSLPHAADPETDLERQHHRPPHRRHRALREHLGIDRWLVWGGSWGVTLALAYAERHPARVTELVLVAITNTTRAEIDWLYGGLGAFFPEQWERFRGFVGGGPDATGTELAAAYDVLLQGPDQAARERAAIEWCAWEDAVVALDAERRPRSLFDDPRQGDRVRPAVRALLLPARLPARRRTAAQRRVRCAASRASWCTASSTSPLRSSPRGGWLRRGRTPSCGSSAERVTPAGRAWATRSARRSTGSPHAADRVPATMGA